MMMMIMIMTIMTITPQASLSMLNLNLPARVWLPLYAADTPHYIVRWQLGIIHRVFNFDIDIDSDNRYTHYLEN